VEASFFIGKTDVSTFQRIVKINGIVVPLLFCCLCSCSSSGRGEVPPGAKLGPREYSLALSHPAHARIEQLYAEARRLFEDKMFVEAIQKFEDVIAMIRVHHDYVDPKGYEDGATFWIGLALQEAKEKEEYEKRDR